MQYSYCTNIIINKNEPLQNREYYWKSFQNSVSSEKLLSKCYVYDENAK